jgi:small subunit ribosomal protein S2
MSVTLNQLFESKVHIGHLTRYWNPKMQPFIFGKRNGMHLIDLEKMKAQLEKALDFLRELGSRKGSKVLFVGTKRIAQAIVKEKAIQAGMPYVDRYWRGGNLTNYRVCSQSAKVLKEMQAFQQQDSFGIGMTKKAIRKFERHVAHLEKGVEGIKDLRLPEALVVFDVGEDRIAVREARKLHIPIIGFVDTNNSPEGIDYVVPANDDAIASIRLCATLAADAIREGQRLISDHSSAEASPQPIIRRIKKSTVNLQSTGPRVSNEPQESIVVEETITGDTHQLPNE